MLGGAGCSLTYSTPSDPARVQLLHRDSPESRGRITTRSIGGRDYDYSYDGKGRLLSYDAPGTAEDATYTYDYAGRRIRMTVGDAVWRFVCDGAPGGAGDDVCAELVDEDGDGDVDRRRYYWTLATPAG